MNGSEYDNIDMSSVTIPPLAAAQIPSISNLYTNTLTSGNSGILGTNFNNGYLYTTNTTQPWTTISTSSPSMNVKGDAAFEGDIKWKGRSLGKLLESIEDRLAILTPDPKKLEKYAALRKAYDHYILLEKLIGED